MSLFEWTCLFRLRQLQLSPLNFLKNLFFFLTEFVKYDGFIKIGRSLGASTKASGKD